MANKWTQANIPDQSGKVVIVTGANSGLGYETSKALAKKGAKVIMAVRTVNKGEQARDEILADVPNADLEVMRLDVGNLASVREFADTFKATYDRLDILANNAGVMAIPRQETADGFEMQLGVNHLGHFALTGLLLDVIVKTPNARIHNVSSSANWSGTINFDDLMGEQDYGRWSAYGQSKLANIFFTYELHNRLRAAGYDTIVNTSHPGLVMTNLQENSLEQSGRNPLESFLYRLAGPLMAQDVNMGMLSQLYGMTAPEAKSGTFYGPGTFNLRGYPAEASPNSEVKDAEALKRFFDVSEELTGVTYNMLERQPA
ncbi:MAG: oxidoreductase [Chloroflexota bacterium]